METIEIKCTGSDTIDIDQLTEFQGALKERDAGLKYYNEIILVNVAGSKAYTAGHDAKLSRKIAKVHQNILCFLKGDSKAACNDLGDFVADNCVLPALQDDDCEYMA